MSEWGLNYQGSIEPWGQGQFMVFFQSSLGLYFFSVDCLHFVFLFLIQSPRGCSSFSVMNRFVLCLSTPTILFRTVSVIKKNEVLPFATTWMDLEGIMLSKISQMEKDTICFHLYVESEK